MTEEAKTLDALAREEGALTMDDVIERVKALLEPLAREPFTFADKSLVLNVTVCGFGEELGEITAADLTAILAHVEELTREREEAAAQLDRYDVGTVDDAGAVCTLAGRVSMLYADMTTAVQMAPKKARCLREWDNVNDPPCHPSDDDWKPCPLCDHDTVEARATKAESERDAALDTAREGSESDENYCHLGHDCECSPDEIPCKYLSGKKDG